VQAVVTRLVRNVSLSMPEGLYLRVGGAIHVGDIVVACLAPADAARARAARVDLVPGNTCPARAPALIKVVVATAGSRIEVDRDGVRVDGRRLRDSQPLPGVPYRTGAVRLSPGAAWLWSPVHGSYDSRYLGALRPLDRVMPLPGLTAAVLPAFRPRFDA
jgi:type IV secretory pathway protease TraF